MTVGEYKNFKLISNGDGTFMGVPSTAIRFKDPPAAGEVVSVNLKMRARLGSSIWNEREDDGYEIWWV